MKELKESIYKHALANAYYHKGKANVNAVLGKVLAEKPELRQMTKHITKEIEAQVKKVNAMGLSAQKRALEDIFPEALEQGKKEKKMAELPNAKKGKVVTRLPPGPSKHLHSGHAISFLINYIYAQKYHGKCILRFDDTDPKKDKLEFVKSIQDDIKNYLEIKVDKTVFASDDIKKMYKEMLKLIEMEKAYVCFCNPDTISVMRREKRSCEHSRQSRAEAKAEFQKMINGEYNPGVSVLRLKGDMKSDNAAMRDPAIARIVKEKHYRQGRKYNVWPLYDFESACEEEFQAVTHVIRGIEFGEERIGLQKYISKLLGFREREFVQYGRMNVAGLEKTSGRHLRELAEKGIPWDNPRMPTLKAMKRRGFVKETFYELAKMKGLAKTPMRIDDTLISAVNRRFVDAFANRYFFVQEPVKLKVRGCNFDEVAMRMHPSKQTIRKVKITNSVYVPKKEFNSHLRKEVRLKDFCNVQLSGEEAVYRSREVQNLPKIEWVNTKAVDAKILMPSGETIKGLAESQVLKEKIGSIIQFERFGFCRLDKKKPLTFVFAHK